MSENAFPSTGSGRRPPEEPYERIMTMWPIRSTIGVVSVLALSACAVAPPSGPRVMALPGAGKDFATFQQEDATCRQFASVQSGGTASAQAATNNAVGTAVVGTAVGAGLGAALGSLSGQVGTGAAIGGAAGALVGGSAGASGAQYSAADLQQRYDSSYTQCMYAHGDTVQSPPGGYRAAGGPYGYPYAYPYPYYGPGYYGPSVVIGTGWGWGWRGGGWHR
jgi:outer membrane lipoprotein SlyB